MIEVVVNDRLGKCVSARLTMMNLSAPVPRQVQPVGQDRRFEEVGVRADRHARREDHPEEVVPDLQGPHHARRLRNLRRVHVRNVLFVITYDLCRLFAVFTMKID